MPTTNMDQALGQLAQDLASLRSRYRPGQERDRYPRMIAEVSADRGVVLLGKNLCRRHDGTLPPIANRNQEGIERHRCLSCPDISLQEAVHRMTGGHVAADLPNNGILVRGELEWKDRPDLFIERIAGLKNIACRFTKGPASQPDPGGESETLFKCQASPGAVPADFPSLARIKHDGSIAGLIAQNMSPYDAAAIGVFIHGAAGEMVAEAMGNTGIIASDLLPMLPQTIRAIREDTFTGGIQEIS